MINVVEVKTKKQQKQFVDFPTKLYSGNAYYVHPLRGDELSMFNPKRNVSYDECEIVYYLAYKGKTVVGRICGVVQKVFNARNNAKMVRFGRFDCIEDFEVAQALLAKVEAWAISQGMEGVHGPLGFNDLEREGLLVDGFDRMPTFEEPYNFPYYKDYLERLGYKKDNDYVSFRITLPEETDPRVLRIGEMVMKKYNLRIATAKNKKEYIKHYKDQIFDVIDEAYGELYGFIPYNEKMRKSIIDQFNLIIKLKYLISIVDENDRVIAFGFALPSLSRAVQKCKGRLFPTGLFSILHARNHVREADFGLIGVRKEYQGKGIPAIILDYVVRNAREEGVTVVETNHSLEDNYKILQTWKNFDKVEQHKRYRLYSKSLKPIKIKTSTTTKKGKATKKLSSKNSNK